jgi:hypothetical protein
LPAYDVDFVFKARNNTRPSVTNKDGKQVNMNDREYKEYKKNLPQSDKRGLGPRWFLSEEVKAAHGQVIKGTADFKGMLQRKWESYLHFRGWTLNMEEWKADPATEQTECDDDDEQHRKKCPPPDNIYTVVSNKLHGVLVMCTNVYVYGFIYYESWYVYYCFTTICSRIPALYYGS